MSNPFMEIVSIVYNHQRDDENTSEAVRRHVWRSRVFFIMSAILGIVAMLELLKLLGG